jgi:hypothetical protein
VIYVASEVNMRQVTQINVYESPDISLPAS